MQEKSRYGVWGMRYEGNPEGIMYLIKEFEVQIPGSPPFQGGDDKKRCEARFLSGVVDDCD